MNYIKNILDWLKIYQKIRIKTFPFNYNVAEYLSELSLNIQVIKSRGTGFKTLLQVQNYTFANLRA